eukprot:6051218-Pyramimonas_sp.AAC.1
MACPYLGAGTRDVNSLHMSCYVLPTSDFPRRHFALLDIDQDSIDVTMRLLPGLIGRNFTSFRS